MLDSLHRNRPAARCLPLSSQLVLALIRGDGKEMKRSCNNLGLQHHIVEKENTGNW
jgi:hypothetical protein